MRPYVLMTSKKPDLDGAYGVQTPKEIQQLYANWADSCDQDFASEMDYRLPGEVARLFVESGGKGPVLDLGAGTGLCGAALALHGVAQVDGTDISQEMLDIAATKGWYRHLFTGDLTDRLPTPAASYAGIVSSGTFTHGHVGPDALDEVLRLAVPQAWIALSINAQHWQAKGFAEKFDALDSQIAHLSLPQVRIYGPKNQTEHRDDLGLVACFQKV